ncbi:MAG TPA: hypothetical protein VN622_00005, partial [Clostridia bacterium]|nr:hypothetical protein [Clostridia bacterium]
MTFEFIPSGPYLSLQLPIRIWGMDELGRPFTQQASTVTIGLEEACVAGLKCIVKLDDILGMSCDARKGRFRVIWVGQAGTPQAG